jgi:hypothetical protein
MSPTPNQVCSLLGFLWTPNGAVSGKCCGPLRAFGAAYGSSSYLVPFSLGDLSAPSASSMAPTHWVPSGSCWNGWVCDRYCGESDIWHVQTTVLADTGEANASAGANNSNPGFILPGTTKDLAIMGSSMALGCQEGTARFQLVPVVSLLLDCWPQHADYHFDALGSRHGPYTLVGALWVCADAKQVVIEVGAFVSYLNVLKG